MAKQKRKRANNEGSVFQLPSGKWRVILPPGEYEGFDSKRPSKVFETQKEGIIWKNAQITAAIERANQSSAVKVNEKLVPAIKRWLLEVRQTEVKSDYFYQLLGYYNKHIAPYFENYNILQVNSKIARDFFACLKKQQVGKEAIRKTKSVLLQFYNYEYRDTFKPNPFANLPLEDKQADEYKVITKEEALNMKTYKGLTEEAKNKLFACLDEEKNPFFKPLFYIMEFNGLRIGEILPLQWGDFDFENRYFVVYKAVRRVYKFDENGNKIGESENIVGMPKSKAGIRVAPLFDVVYEQLMEWKEICAHLEKIDGISRTKANDYIFKNNKGQMRSRDGTSCLVRRFIKRHNLEAFHIHCHALRHDFSQRMYLNNENKLVIKSVMGHASERTTDKHYASTEKIKMAQKLGKDMNSLFPPSNEKYKAGPDVNFAPANDENFYIYSFENDEHIEEIEMD